jgi:hypothetical protein
LRAFSDNQKRIRKGPRFGWRDRHHADIAEHGKIAERRFRSVVIDRRADRFGQAEGGDDARYVGAEPRNDGESRGREKSCRALDCRVKIVGHRFRHRPGWPRQQQRRIKCRT